MKKLVVAAAAMLASAAVFADVTFSGFVRGGWAAELSDKGKNGKAQATGPYQAGEVLGAGSNTRFNLAWEGEHSGAYIRIQDPTAAASLDTLNYAYAWANLFNDVVTVTAGRTKDDWISAGGYADFSFIDGENAVGLFVKPVEGLTIGGGSIVGYGKYVYKDADGDGKDDTYDYLDFGVQSLYGGAKYATDQLSVAVAGQGAGAVYAGFTYTVEDTLLLAFEAAYRTDKFVRGDEDIPGETPFAFNDSLYNPGNNVYNNLTLVQQVEFTGVEKLKLGVVAYEHLLTHFGVDKKGKEVKNAFAAVFYPYVSYDINETFTVSAEAATWIYDGGDNDKTVSLVDVPDSYTTITPALNIHADESATVSVWANISTDTEQEEHSTGIGVEFKF